MLFLRLYKLDFIVLSSSYLYLIIILPGAIYLINSFLNYYSEKIYLLSKNISAYTCVYPEMAKSLDSL